MKVGHSYRSQNRTRVVRLHISRRATCAFAASFLALSRVASRRDVVVILVKSWCAYYLRAPGRGRVLPPAASRLPFSAISMR